MIQFFSIIVLFVYSIHANAVEYICHYTSDPTDGFSVILADKKAVVKIASSHADCALSFLEDGTIHVACSDPIGETKMTQHFKFSPDTLEGTASQTFNHFVLGSVSIKCNKTIENEVVE